jgi:hypothetical protein
MSFSFDNFSVTAIGDETPPTQAANFTLTPGADRNSLTWTNPTDEDWRWTRIVRTDAAPSAHPRGGYPVYEGKLAYYNDIDLTPGAPHYYAAYTVDHSGNYSEPIALAVNVSPVVTTDPADLTVGLGQTAMFSIQASPQPLTYLWLKDKSPLSDDGRITGSATPALSIQNATLADEAAYSCVATNNSLAPQTAISAEGRLSIARSQSSEWLGYK